MQPRASLKKCEILRRKNDIETLFREGKPVRMFPLKILYQVQSRSEVKPKIQVMFVVSRRMVKKAVQRNRIKRCMREAYRLSKHDIFSLIAQKCPSIGQVRLALFFQSTSSEGVSTEKIKAVLKRGIEKMVTQISGEHSHNKTQPEES